MKATGNFEAARDVDPQVVLSDKTRAHIDHWLSKFPPDRKRSAVLQGLHAAQEQNQGWLTDELIVGVAKYLDLPPVWAYEVASFYSMFETERSAATTWRSAPTSAAGSMAPKICWRMRKRSWVASWGSRRPMAASTSSAKKSAWRPAPRRR